MKHLSHSTQPGTTLCGESIARPGAADAAACAVRAAGGADGGAVATYGLVFVEDEPDELEPLKLYAVGENGHLWHVTMLCPCSCRERVSLNLLPDDFPCWTLLNDAGTPTLRPSVWRKVGCRSHYILRGGRIIWCSTSSGTG